jgi:deoxyxylulose-5-phosphate synthase
VYLQEIRQGEKQMYIENINGPEDVKKLSEDQLNVLAEEIRDALLKHTKTI